MKDIVLKFANSASGRYKGKNGNTTTDEGTSFAAPVVAGYAAMLKGYGVTDVSDIEALLDGFSYDVDGYNAIVWPEDVSELSCEIDTSYDDAVVKYTGKAKKPEIIVEYESSNLGYNHRSVKSVPEALYSVSYSNNTKVGTATVTVTGKYPYFGTKKLTFKIIPKTPSVTVKSSTAKKTLKLSWTQDCDDGFSYEIAYKKASDSTYKKITTSKKSYKLTGLVSGKKYNVKIRAYKKPNGKTYYSDWSSVSTVKVK